MIVVTIVIPVKVVINDTIANSFISSTKPFASQQEVIPK